MQPNENVFQQFLEALQMLTEAPQEKTDEPSEKPSELSKPKPRALALPELLTERREPPPENLTELISLFMQYRVDLVQLLQTVEKLLRSHQQLKDKLEMIYQSREESELTTITANYIDYIINNEVYNLKRFLREELEKTDLEWSAKIEAMDLPEHVADQLFRTARSYIQEAILRAIPNYRFFR